MCIRDRFGDYVKFEAMKAVKESPRIRDTTRERYVLCLSIASEALGKYPIADALRAGNFGKALSTIAQKHGTTTARQVRKVVNKWVIQPLILSGVLASNPIAGLSFDLPEHKASNKPDGGKGLTESEWTRAVNWLDVYKRQPSCVESTMGLPCSSSSTSYQPRKR